MRILLVSFMSAFAAFTSVAIGKTPAKAYHGPSASRSCLPTVVRQALEDIENKFGEIEVISTHRPGAVVVGSGRRSKHADCRAADFNPPSGKYTQVVAWLNENHKGGVGTYSCGMHHIHIDNGESRHWHKCVGGTRTVSNRGGNSKSGSASTRKYGTKSRSASSRYGSKSRSASSLKYGSKYRTASNRKYGSRSNALSSRTYGSTTSSRKYVSKSRSASSRKYDSKYRTASSREYGSKYKAVSSPRSSSKSRTVSTRKYSSKYAGKSSRNGNRG
jgi:hypothetical protein